MQITWTNCAAAIYLCALWAMSVWTAASIMEMTMEDNEK